MVRQRIMVKYHQRRSFQDQRRKVCTTGFLALQFIVKCLKAPTLRVSPWRGCILTLTQTQTIITDVTIRMPGKAGTMMMEVKVDPGAQPSCIPLHKFKTLFPHLCRDGLPKEGLLDNTQNEFKSYNGGDMTCYWHLLIDVKDKVTKKYHPIRFYVMNTDVLRILISNAASYFEDTKIQGRKRATRVRPGRDVDVSDGEQHSQEEPSATTGKEPKTSKSGNLVHSGPNKNITDSVKDSPFSNQTTDSSNAKSGPKMKHTSNKEAMWLYAELFVGMC